MRRRRTAALVAVGASAALLAACGGGGDTGGGGDGDAVTLTWWHNATDDPLAGFWEDVAGEFEAEHDGVTIEITPVQNEDFDTKLQVAIQGGNPPDLFQQWGGGQMADQVAAGALLDISDDVTAELESMGDGSAVGWQVDGQTYGLPYSLGVVGFWYNTTLFEQAGIDSPPATMDELFDAVETLRAAGTTPILVGAKDQWPAAHYYYYAAVRTCSEDTLAAAGAEFDFSDPCFVEAGELVQQVVDAEPFQEGFLGTPAQQGATSSAAMLANGDAAMELMGHWHPGVMGGLTEDGEGLGEDTGWFPFPAVDGGAGDPAAAMGGGDGFSCSSQAPPECVEFLRYLLSVDVQTRFAETGAGLPVVAGSDAGVSDPTMASLLETRDDAPYVQLYLDIAYGNNIGGALNEAVALMFAGQAGPQDIVDAMQTAADSQ